MKFKDILKLIFLKYIIFFFKKKIYNLKNFNFIKIYLINNNILKNILQDFLCIEIGMEKNRIFK